MVSLTHLGASTGLRSQQFCIGFAARAAFLAIFWPSMTPPANLVKLFWFKMACTGVPHIVLRVLCWTCTSGFFFRPSKVSFGAIYADSDWQMGVFGPKNIVKGGMTEWKRASINNQPKLKCDEVIGACSGMAGSRIQVMELLRSGDCRRMTLTQVIFFFLFLSFCDPHTDDFYF